MGKVGRWVGGWVWWVGMVGMRKEIITKMECES